MKKPVIAIDCDDVLILSAAPSIEHYNRMHGTKVLLEHFYADQYEVWGADRTEISRRVHEFIGSEEFRQTAPLEGAVKSLRRLAERYELHVVTGRNTSVSATTEYMVKTYFDGLFASIEYTSFYSDNPRSKADVCRELNATYLIDDHLHHAEVVARSGTPVLLFGDYPWNRAGSLPPLVSRVADWNEVCDVLLSE